MQKKVFVMAEDPNVPKEKEIDLFVVLAKIASGFGKIFTLLFHGIKVALVWSYAFIRKHFWVFLILVLLGGVGGYLKSKLEKPYYQTEMLIETQLVPRAQIAERINSLQQLISEKNESLAGALHLSQADMISLFYIRADIVSVSVDVQTTRNPTDTLPVVRQELGPQFIRITIRLWDNRSIRRLQTAILEFIESDSYTKERWDLFKSNNQAQQTAIMEEIAQLQLFQKKNVEKNNSLLTLSSTPLVVQNEERTYVEEILSLKSRLSALQNAYQITRPASVILPFLPFQSPVNTLFRNIMLFAGLCMLAGFVFFLILDNWKKI